MFISLFLSHLDEPNLRPVITDESVTFSTSNASQCSIQTTPACRVFFVFCFPLDSFSM